MIVSDRMTKNPVTVSPEDTLVSAQEKMRPGAFRQIPVFDKERLIGIITDRNIRGDTTLWPGSNSQTEGVITITPDTSIEEAARILLEHKIGGLPVVENEQLVGIISTTDILRAFVDFLASTHLTPR